MKKIILAAAVAAAFSGAAHAVTYNVSSNITGFQLFYEGTDVIAAEPGGYFTGIQFSGTATDADNDGIIDSSSISMTGEAGFVLASLPGRVIFDLNNGGYAAGAGTSFTGGTVTLLVQDWSSGTGIPEWMPYSTITTSPYPLQFLAGSPVHWGSGAQTSGLLLTPGTTTLPGLWNGNPGDTALGNEIGMLYLAYFPIGMFLEGSVTLTPVPVPGAAWLFGSAVLGAGAMTRRRAARS